MAAGHVLTERPPAEEAAEAGETVRLRLRTSARQLRELAAPAVALLAVLLAATFAVVATTAGLLRDQLPATYSVAGIEQPWLQAGSSGSTAWFRHDLSLPSRPVAAAIAVDGSDKIRVWMNGRSLVARGTNAHDTAELATTADIAPSLRTGENSLLIEVTTVSGGIPRLWADLALTLDDGSRQHIATASPGWQATTDPALIGARLGALPAAALPGSTAAAQTRWPSAQSSPAPREVRATMPPQVVALARGRTAVTTEAPEATLFGQTGAATTDAWLRISATARASITVNGRVVEKLPAPPYVSPRSTRPGVLTVVHLGPLPAHSRVAIRMTGSFSSTVYCDLVVPQGRGWEVQQLPAASWSALNGRGAGAEVSTVDVLGAWPNGLHLGIQSVQAPASTALGWELAIAGAVVLLLVGVALVVPGLRRGGHRRAWTLLVAGSLPAVAGCAAYLAWQRWTGHLPDEGRFEWAVVILALWVAGMVACTLGLPRLPVPRRIGALISPGILIYVIALASGVWVFSGIRRNALWQDEATSLQVARDISAHGLPRLGSDLLYFKAELYHVLLAAVIHISDNVVFLRAISDVFFVGTVIVFGRILMPVLAPGRPWLHLAATVALVLLPNERVWADQLRMYQLMQFFSILFLAFLLRALSTGRARDIRWAAAFLLLTYLSHEESFVLLPGVAVLALVRWRAVLAARLQFALAFIPVGLLIGAQYLLAQVHPAVFGTDLSNRPYVGLDLGQATFYYDTVFFSPIGAGASLAVLSTLAVIGGVAAARRGDAVVLGAGIMLLSSLLTASLLFTAKVARYAFVLLPPLVALAVLGALALWGAVGHLLRRAAGGGLARGRSSTRRGVLIAGAATAAMLAVATAATTVMSLPQLTRPASFHPDYAATVGYLNTHRSTGDVTVTLSPPVMTSHYAGRLPDRVVQTGANKLLYVTAKQGMAVDTILGVPVLLTGDDVRRYVSAHARVWLVSDTGGYLANLPADVRKAIVSEFHVVYQNGSTTLSVAGYET